MLSTVLAILSEPVVFQMITTLLLSGGTALLGRIALLKGKEVTIAKAKDSVAAAVTDLYPVVKALKAANDGKLTEPQKLEMQARALARATEIGRTFGVDVMKVLGIDLAKAVIEHTIVSFKPKMPVLPAEVAVMLPDTPPEGFYSPKAIGD